MSPIRILIADDALEFRKSVRTMLALERDMEVVALARDGQEAVEMAQKLQPDVAVMDINMPRMSGLAAIRNMQAASPGTVPMIISSEEQRDTLLEAMALGVRDYLLKPFTADALTAAIRKAAAQGTQAKTQAEAAKAAATPATAIANLEEAPDQLILQVGVTMEEAERRLILKTLAHTEGNRTKTAEVLGISIRTLRNKLNEYKEKGIEVD